MMSGLALLAAATGPIALVLGGIGLGLVLERLFLPRVPSLEGAMHGTLPVLLGLVGIELALPTYPMAPDLVLRVQDALVVVAIAAVTMVFSRLVGLGVRGYVRRADLPAAAMLVDFASGSVSFIGALIALETIGISVMPIVVALAVGGFAFAFALKDSLAGLFAGVEILASHQIAPGDYIRLETGLEGFVTHVTWRNTTIRELANNLIVVPNEKLARTIFTNYSAPELPTAVSATIGVDYSSDLEHVERVTYDVARTLQHELCGIDLGYDPVVRFRAFGDSSVEFRVTFRAPTFADTFRAKSTFIKRLHVRYRAEHITIPFPVRTIEIADKSRKKPNAEPSMSPSEARPAAHVQPQNAPRPPIIASGHETAD